MIQVMVTEEELEQIVSVVIERIKPFIVECMNKASETALLALPEVQRQQILMQESKRKMVTEFYENHKELQTHKPIVSTVIEQSCLTIQGLSIRPCWRRQSLSSGNGEDGRAIINDET